ncbi:MAG: histidine phosphatase family protein [Dehalococcoidia bacterium]|nr:histidine phosphatase family protein [Dehalococcoidia bacterium]
MLTRILLTRHGQTEWNRVERFRGRADINLNETGLRQARATAERMSELRPVAIYSSPLKRALLTAQAIADALGLSVIAAPDLIDVDYGTWQGLTIEEARQQDPDAFAQWRKSPDPFRFPGGESMKEVRQRVAKVTNSLWPRYPEQTVAVVTHVTLCRLITLHLLGLGTSHFWKVTQDNCAVSIFEIRADINVALSLNDTCHLRGCQSA